MSDSKPYEIRRDIISLAQNLLLQNMHVQMEVANRLNQPLKVAPQVTSEQIVAEAEKLYAFVSKK
jgi:hypothetical protein